jgi:hypothetical protein
MNIASDIGTGSSLLDSSIEAFRRPCWISNGSIESAEHGSLAIGRNRIQEYLSGVFWKRTAAEEKVRAKALRSILFHSSCESSRSSRLTAIMKSAWMRNYEESVIPC